MIALCLAFAGFALGFFCHALLTIGKVTELEAEVAEWQHKAQLGQLR